jgi:hypothetical protein
MSLPNYMYGVPHGILQVFILILYENLFQNPELFPTQVSLSPEQSTLAEIKINVNFAAKKHGASSAALNFQSAKYHS